MQGYLTKWARSGSLTKELLPKWHGANLTQMGLGFLSIISQRWDGPVSSGVWEQNSLAGMMLDDPLTFSLWGTSLLAINSSRPHSSVYGLAKKSVWFFSIREKTHISFSLITLLIWIFWVCWLSPEWYNVDCQLTSQLDHYQLQLVYPTVEHRPARNLQLKTSQTNFDTFNQSQHLFHTLHKSFSVF